MDKFDLIIIGGGGGGFAAATVGSELGARVAMVNSGLPLGGLAVTLLLMYGSSYLSRLYSGAKDIGTKKFFINFAYVAVPLGIMKFISDIIDHVFRTWVQFSML